jgi:S1-C subfamily serine protease/tetratricopeptide (TPR) repeat protein
MRELWHEHKWEIILGLVFAVLFGVAWEAAKLAVEKADHVGPDRLAAGTVRVMVAVNLRNDAQRRAVEEWSKQHDVIATPDFAILQMASGFAVSDDGWIVTAAHVVRTKRHAPLLATLGEPAYVVVHYPSGEEARATIVETNERADTSVLKSAHVPKDHFLVLGDAGEAHRLDRVLAIGYPDVGDFFSMAEPTMTSGEISKVAEQDFGGRVFQTTAPIRRGNSGGPLVDAESRVIGINVSMPKEEGTQTEFAFSIEPAKEILKKQKAKLPHHYEREGLLRQPAVWWAGLSSVGVFLALYAGIVMRPLWRRLFAGEPGVAGFWLRATAFVIDAAIVMPLFLLLLVVLIVAIGRFMPLYGYGVVLLVPCWWLYAWLCKRRWRATLGQRAAGLRVDGRVVIAKPRSPWKLLPLGMLALIVALLAVPLHLGFLANRALDDIHRVDFALWHDATPDTARLLAKRTDRLRWLTTFHPPSMHDEDALYGQGLALMAAGKPREAIREFEAAAGDTWQALNEPGRSRSSVVDSAAAKSGWCYFDLGDYAHARAMFDYVLKGYSRDRDSLLGMAVTSMRLHDDDAVRGAWESLVKYEKRSLAEIAHARTRAGAPYHLTSSQLAAVHELQAAMAKAPPPSAPPPLPARRE